MDKQWAQAPVPRHQQVLYPEMLDEVVGPDHMIRRLDAILLGLDWGPWELHYDGRRGQPPLHPRLMAGAILYGLMRKIQSSRELEAARRERLDFLWFLEGRTIDHSTFAGFRSRFGAELKDLFKQVARLICQTREDTLAELIIDGTRMRANSDRHGARTAQWLEQQVARCVGELEQRLARLGQSDDRQTTADEETEGLRAEVARLQTQVACYERALAQAHKRDSVKQAKEGKGAVPVRVPVTDPDSMIVPNKEGGFAPNYTPTVAVDGASGMIVSADVLQGSDENTAVLPAIAQAEAIGDFAGPRTKNTSP
jgi:transposase